MPIDKLVEHSRAVGLARCCDVSHVYHKYIRDAEYIMDLGSGYGRIINNLMGREFAGKICAIERNRIYLENLKSQFSDPPVTCIADLKDVDSSVKFCVALIMWSTLAESQKDEQIKLLGLIKQKLAHDGIVIIDLPQIIDARPLDKKSVRKQIKSKYGNITLFFPSADDIEYYCKNLGYVLGETVKYITDTGLKRAMFILHGSPINATAKHFIKILN